MGGYRLHIESAGRGSPTVVFEAGGSVSCETWDPVWSTVHDIHDVPAPFRQEIEHFFQVYKDLEEKPTETSGFGNRAEALEVLEDARARADTRT